MKFLKIVPILLLLVSIIGCKKKNLKPDAFDPTKYSIIGKLFDGYPYIISIESDKAVLTHYSVTEGTYSLKDGVLSFNFNNEVICSFVTEKGLISSYKGPIAISTNDLVKIPSISQIAAQTFKGNWNNSGYPTQLTFSTTQVKEITNNQQSVANYTAINNLAVKKQEGAELTVFIVVGDKLEGGRQKYPNTFWGAFTKQ